jgi:hypothetical protein
MGPQLVSTPCSMMTLRISGANLLQLLNYVGGHVSAHSLSLEAQSQCAGGDAQRPLESPRSDQVSSRRVTGPSGFAERIYRAVASGPHSPVRPHSPGRRGSWKGLYRSQGKWPLTLGRGSGFVLLEVAVCVRGTFRGPLSPFCWWSSNSLDRARRERGKISTLQRSGNSTMHGFWS